MCGNQTLSSKNAVTVGHFIKLDGPSRDLKEKFNQAATINYVKFLFHV
jgi:hypothetical protein